MRSCYLTVHYSGQLILLPYGHTQIYKMAPEKKADTYRQIYKMAPEKKADTHSYKIYTATRTQNQTE